MTTAGALCLYLALLHRGIPLRAIDPGERVTLPQKRACACGKRKPKWAPKKQRWICECGKAWPMQTFVSGGARQRRANPPGERQLDFMAEVGVALTKLSRARRRILLLWHDRAALPHERGRWRQTEVAAALRSKPDSVVRQYDEALAELDAELSRRGVTR